MLKVVWTHWWTPTVLSKGQSIELWIGTLFLPGWINNMVLIPDALGFGSKHPLAPWRTWWLLFSWRLLSPFWTWLVPQNNWMETDLSWLSAHRAISPLAIACCRMQTSSWKPCLMHHLTTFCPLHPEVPWPSMIPSCMMEVDVIPNHE